jgi:hypothetical protein
LRFGLETDSGAGRSACSQTNRRTEDDGGYDRPPGSLRVGDPGSGSGDFGGHLVPMDDVRSGEIPGGHRLGTLKLDGGALLQALGLLARG